MLIMKLNEFEETKYSWKYGINEIGESGTHFLLMNHIELIFAFLFVNRERQTCAHWNTLLAVKYILVDCTNICKTQKR